MKNDDAVPGDWIQELFPPTYAASISDMRPEEPIKSKIRKATPFDSEAIQRVYEKVRVMTILDDELKQQTRDREIAELTGKDSRVNDGQGLADSLDKTAAGGNPINLDDTCVWETDELETLRNVYKTAKWKIKDLEVEVLEKDRKCALLENENIELKREQRTKSDLLKEARKANQRLQIHCANLKEQYNFVCAKLDAVTAMWKEISEEKATIMKEVQTLRVQADQARLNCNRIQLKVEESERKVQREKELVLETAQFKYEKTIVDLKRELKETNALLVKEQQTHNISEKALDSLRRHFASLPVNHILPPNAVLEDQVTNISHLGL